MSKPVHLIVSLGVAMLGAAATIWTTGDKRWTPPAPRLPDAGLYQIPESPGVRFALPPEPSLAARPVFSESRRPPPADVAENPAKDEPDPLRDVKVLGLFGSGNDAGGILQVDGKVQRIHVGEKLGPWELRSVKGIKAEFSRPGGRRTTLELKYLPQPAISHPVSPKAGAPENSDKDISGQNSEPQEQGQNHPDRPRIAARTQKSQAEVVQTNQAVQLKK
ncbi:hypothetical protein [Pseudothauera hydrothermalis]|uniref:hypothetical protein n=1 Tax=Pseudothauera hydrothermalis TaxID=2184083 RepID=UPI0013156593|nr:hypothetical protein [Pseudothauera hydrothermalis]